MHAYKGHACLRYTYPLSSDLLIQLDMHKLEKIQSEVIICTYIAIAHKYALSFPESKCSKDGPQKNKSSY